MRYKLLGKSGLRVSEVSMGTMSLGFESDVTAGPDESRRIIDKYVEAGGNYFDGGAYNGGTAEVVLGEFLKADRNPYVVTSKYSCTAFSGIDPSVKDDPNRGGNHKKSMVQAVEGSLERLSVDYLDLLWLHHWEYTTDIADVMRAVNDLVRQGKILHFGMCNAPAWVVARGQSLAVERGWEPISALQYQYNLVSRDLELEILPAARSLGIAMNAYSPLAGGFLTGKYTRGGSNESKRYDNPIYSALAYFGVKEYAVAKKVDEIADRVGTSSAAVALDWVRQRGAIPILGPRTVGQFEDALKYLSLSLTEEDLNRLTELGEPELSWTYNLLHGKDTIIRQLSAGGMLDKIDNENWPA